MIKHGSNLKNKNVNKDATQAEFKEWRQNCINIITSANDSESLLNRFKDNTDLRDDNYTAMPNMITEGLEILEELKGNLKRN